MSRAGGAQLEGVKTIPGAHTRTTGVEGVV
jgi:hypothetical protein